VLSEKDIRIRYFGHATVLLETRSSAVLVDPIIPVTPASGPPRLSFTDLPERIDLVLITHGHPDHLHLETLLQIRHLVHTVVVPHSGSGRLENPNLRLLLQSIGFRSVRELAVLDRIELADGCVTGMAFTGEHGDLDIAAKLVYHVRLLDRSFVLAADAANNDSTMIDRLRDAVGEVDTLFIGMESGGAPVSWLYGPLITAPLERDQDSARRLAGADAERACDMAERFRCREVFFYAMGEEPWMECLTGHRYEPFAEAVAAVDRLSAAMRAHGMTSMHLTSPRELLYRRDRDNRI
jgi:L-ascorbate metabolism protein UlaG (beta-lactamase superfamily)